MEEEHQFTSTVSTPLLEDNQYSIEKTKL